ncbi:PIF1 [Diaporthe eres]|uniref:ATP-dependent DNA helicase n=1 Tax=Diaporthe vaccinii TaxID=105482 RepID=A0ABR4DQA0_9PEZI|nr:PIF1 [Diaporthe eres]
MVLPRGQTIFGPHYRSSFHCVLSLRLVQQSQGLGRPPWRVSGLGCRALSSVNKYAQKRAKELSNEAISAILSCTNTDRTEAPKSKPKKRRTRKEPESRGSSEPLHVDGPRLSPEQAEVVELAASGRNIFYTGSAGCGKSTVLRALVQRLSHMGKRVRVVAPTGRAALAINGTTTWTFAGWSPNSHKLGIEQLRVIAKKKGSAVRRRFRRTDVVIIDEVSMVENLHLERLNQVMRAARHKPGYPAQQYPFGGVQVIVTGDFAQLPPVRPFRHCMECGGEMEWDDEDETHHCGRCSAKYHESEKWAFQSKAWEECDFAYVHLDTIHRQRDADFISLLNKCRLGEAFTPEEVNLLMNHETNTTGAVELYSTREEVRLVNERGFRNLVAKSYSFQCHDTFVWNREKHPHLEGRGDRHADGSLKSLDEHSMDRLVELKCGIPVVLLVNLDMDNGLCNGSQGVVVGWTLPDRSGTQLPLSSGGHGELKEIERTTYKETVDEPVWPIVRFSNGIECPIRAECQVNELGDDEPYSLLCRTQIPLTPAWALSIHRAQGMTLDKVKVDVSKAFVDGQVYVALSRATSLQGLEVVGNARGLAVGVGGNKEVRSFYKRKFGR